MTHRRWHLGIQAILLVGMIALSPVGHPARAAVRPNFVVIVTDDQRWDTIGRCLGGFDGLDLAAGSDSCMPLLQQDLVADGTTFLKGYVSQALCCPSRASILTGQYSWHTGVTSNTPGFAAFHDGSTLATWLHAAGYRTGLFGKYLNGYGDDGQSYVPPGWDAFHSYYGFVAAVDNAYSNYPWFDWDAGGTGVQSRRSTANSTSGNACAAGNYYSTDFICNLTLGFMTANESQPFFAYVATASPHETTQAADRWRKAYQGLATPQYPDLNNVPTPNPPSYLPASLTSDQLNGQAVDFRGQLETNRAVDDMVDAFYDQLVADGRIGNTVFVFISDNGLAQGEHRWRDKECEYEICHRVPFVVVCPPAVCPGSQPGGVDASHFALNVDIAPTIADLADATPTLRVDGTSLAPILENPGASWRTSWLLHDNDPLLNGIVGPGADGHVYKYVEFLSTGERELLDLTADPWELSNLAGDGPHATTQSTLASTLADGMTAPTVTITGTPAPVTSQTSAAFSFISNEAASFECTLDGGSVQACGSGSSGSISYSGLSAGSHTFTVQGIDEFNNPGTATFTWSVSGAAIAVTLSSPTADALLRSTRISVRWSAAATTYDVYERIGVNGAQTRILTGTTRTSTTRTGVPGGTYCYTVVAFDASGNTGSSSEQCAGVPLDDRASSIAYGGPVTQSSSTGPYSGTLSTLTGTGSQASLSFTGRMAGLLVQTNPSSGQASVLLDGVQVATADLYSRTLRNTIYVWTSSPLAYGAHTLQVTWAGTKNASSTGTAISIDGIATIG